MLRRSAVLSRAGHRRVGLSVAAGMALAIAVSIPGCRGSTSLYGELYLEPGSSGDVAGTRVDLFSEADSTKPAAYSTYAVAVSGTYLARFEYPDLGTGWYFLRAWKDGDSDGMLSDGDLMGVFGGEYTPGYWGERLVAVNGKATDVGRVGMWNYRAVETIVTGVRSEDLSTTTFTYLFNHDVNLTALEVDFPGLGIHSDIGAPGAKEAHAVYTSSEWRLTTGEMPTGWHRLLFAGQREGQAFQVVDSTLVE